MKRLIALFCVFMCGWANGGTLWITNSSPNEIDWAIFDGDFVLQSDGSLAASGVVSYEGPFTGAWSFYAYDGVLEEDISYNLPGSGDWALNYLGTGDVGTFTPIAVPEPATGSLLFYAAGWAVSYFLTRQIRP